jgi:hypothetical protein
MWACSDYTCPSHASISHGGATHGINREKIENRTSGTDAASNPSVHVLLGCQGCVGRVQAISSHLAGIAGDECRLFRQKDKIDADRSRWSGPATSTRIAGPPHMLQVQSGPSQSPTGHSGRHTGSYSPKLQNHARFSPIEPAIKACSLRRSHMDVFGIFMPIARSHRPWRRHTRP